MPPEIAPAEASIAARFSWLGSPSIAAKVKTLPFFQLQPATSHTNSNDREVKR